MNGTVLSSTTSLTERKRKARKKRGHCIRAFVRPVRLSSRMWTCLALSEPDTRLIGDDALFNTVLRYTEIGMGPGVSRAGSVSDGKRFRRLRFRLVRKKLPFSFAPGFNVRIGWMFFLDNHLRLRQTQL